jgi:hypothetical protein
MFKFEISYKHNPLRGGGGVETCRRGGRPVEEADSVEAS